MNVLVIIPTLDKQPMKTIHSVFEQSFFRDHENDFEIIVAASEWMPLLKEKGVIVVYSRPNMKEPKGLRIAKAMNAALNKFDISGFDYILKVDSDVILPSNFLESNIKGNYELMGMGRAMLFKVSSFKTYSDGRFFECATEDTYLYTEFQAAKAKILPWKWITPPIETEKHVCKYTQKELFLIGIDAGRMQKLIWWRHLITRPIQIPAWIIGWFFFPPFPVVWKRKLWRFYRKHNWII